MSRRDEGFGLIEAAVTISLLGIMAAGMAASVSSMMRLEERTNRTSAGVSAVSLVVGADMVDPCDAGEASSMVATAIAWAPVDSVTIDCTTVAGVALVEVVVDGAPFRGVRTLPAVTP